MNKGFLISFEGGEGSGKSTQSKLLFNYLQKQGIEAILTREPGGCDNAETIRSLLVSGNIDWNGLTEAILHNAARSEHIEKTIKPALDNKKIVITDRFKDSTLVYQGYGHGENIEDIKKLNDIASKNIDPDLSLIFDIDVDRGLARAGKRNDNEDRYEKLGIDFHKKIREGFLEIYKENKDRCVLINAEKSIEELHQEILDILKDRNII